ncbi:uncharacterized protein LOC115921661 [Strongylocentrotus purpuratus]|uniref:Uncharacterized protein n=1 Tax=Strongylocentrotus purpuratus TaxID=7668 RepID=A0A7M7NET9_STRPU|nr:uncharacterized protein LOC115921661 [Strongylocentrotus purpuratus]
MDLYASLCSSLLFLVSLMSVAECYRMPLVGRTRPQQQCPINNDLTFQHCMSACQSHTCEDVINEPPSGSWPCIRMCVSGWACPRGQVRLDGYTDVCTARDMCTTNETSCNHNNEVVRVNTNFFDGDMTCRCFVDGIVRCRNAFPTE